MKNIKNQNFDNFIDSCGEEEPNYEKSFFEGWDRCKKEIFKILEENKITPNDDWSYIFIDDIRTEIENKI